MGSQPYLYLALNAWLQKSDDNYIGGRLLWLNHFLNGASNLLWLSSEQIIKILLLQKETWGSSERSYDLEELHIELENKGKSLGHDVKKLINKINGEYPDLDISKFEMTLKKLNDYFIRRYVVHSTSLIMLSMLDEVDELYFLLRSKVHADVGLGTIDEIHIQRKNGWKHPIPAFSYAYMQNRYFKNRKHREINYRLPDGSTCKESGE